MYYLIELSTSLVIVGTMDAFHVMLIARPNQGVGKAWSGISDNFGQVANTWTRPPRIHFEGNSRFELLHVYVLR